MGSILSMAITVGLMLLVVFLFRLVLRRPRGVSLEDPPGVRTVAVFSGDDPELFRDDREDGPFVGIRLFQMLCDGLDAAGIRIARQAPVQCAQGAECVVQDQRFKLVLEWIEGIWVASVEWAPTSGAERRHMAITNEVFAPHDTPALRRLLEVLDRWLKSHPLLKDVRWHRKEKWVHEDPSDAAEGPLA